MIEIVSFDTSRRVVPNVKKLFFDSSNQLLRNVLCGVGKRFMRALSNPSRNVFPSAES